MEKIRIPAEFQIVWIYQVRSEPKLSANVISQQKMTGSNALPLTKIPGSAHRRYMLIPGPLAVAVLVFNVPQTAKVIWTGGHGLKSYLIDL